MYSTQTSIYTGFARRMRVLQKLLNISVETLSEKEKYLASSSRAKTYDFFDSTTYDFFSWSDAFCYTKSADTSKHLNIPFFFWEKPS